jgi:hypothetical protein
MRRVFAFCLIFIAGCQAIQEQKGAQTLPTDGPPLSYREVVQRARGFATTATEAFYVDNWTDVESTATQLEQAALYLPRSSEIPATRKASLDASVKTLAAEAVSLREAAKAKDEQKTNATLQRIHMRVRELRE